MIRVAVCSKDSAVIEQVQKIAGTVLGIGKCDGYQELKNLFFALEGGEQYKAIFLDIRWDREAKGLDAAEKIFKTKPEIEIVYMSAYPERYIQQIFLKSVNVSGFLIKPIDEKVLEEILLKVEQKGQKKDPNSLLVKHKSTVHSIRFDEIVYLESAGHVVTIHTRSEEHNCYTRLEKLYERLPEYFIQCHKSYVVNMNEIQRIEKSQVMLANETNIPISKARYKETKSRYGRYVEQIPK